MRRSIYVLIGAITVVFVWIIVKNHQSTPTNDEPTTPSNSLRMIPLRSANLPTTETITIGTPQGLVEVKNFYKIAQGQEGSSILLENKDGYRITYNTTDSSFWIFILTGPANATEATADADLMQILGISKEKTCALKTSWSVAPEVNGDLAGKDYPLSFCSVSVQ